MSVAGAEVVQEVVEGQGTGVVSAFKSGLLLFFVLFFCLGSL